MIWQTRNNRPVPQARAPQAAAGRSESMPPQWSPRIWLRVVAAAVYVASIGLAVRLLVTMEGGGALPWYTGLLALFFLLFTFVWLRTDLPVPVLQLAFAVQSLVVLGLVALNPESDYAASFFVPLAYQAALVFKGTRLRIWVGVFVALIAASLMIGVGALRGLGLALPPMAVAIALPALAVANRDVELARAASQKMVDQLKEAHQQLERYAAQADELAVLEERNRLARELHDSVSQAMFSVLLSTRSAQIVLEKDPEAARVQLGQLQNLTQDALVRMRGFIAELRPKTE